MSRFCTRWYMRSIIHVFTVRPGRRFRKRATESYDCTRNKPPTISMTLNSLVSRNADVWVRDTHIWQCVTSSVTMTYYDNKRARVLTILGGRILEIYAIPEAPPPLGLNFRTSVTKKKRI